MSAEVVDIRSLVPLDMETILASLRKDGQTLFPPSVFADPSPRPRY
ncbi:MAG: hypothetical protein PHG96_09345 [Kiritimatiellae bacterium]|nr:hypothetical protein [Kiritimatiellia bacterium]MDD4026135.1 hypothetical protein [Kiritimatiellia bacterium]